MFVSVKQKMRLLVTYWKSKGYLLMNETEKHCSVLCSKHLGC